MTPTTRLVAPDGTPLPVPGATPLPGGSRGAPAIDANGKLRCVACLGFLPEDHGRSPYCADCREAARKKAVGKRNAKRQAATAQRNALRGEVHWEGDGYTHGRTGLYIDADLLQDLRNAVAAMLTTHATWSEVAASPYRPELGQQYHDGLKDVLQAIADANDWLRGPFWPRTDRAATRVAPEQGFPAESPSS